MYEKQTAVLGCPCREFPPMADPAPILAAYRDARKRAERRAAGSRGVLRGLLGKAARERFVPVLVAVGEDSPLDEGGDETPEARRERLLSRPVGDGGAFLSQLAARNREFAAKNGWRWPGEDVLGPMEGGEVIDRFLGISDFRGKTVPLVLAEVPAAHPWEVFAWIPFGGWNECPAAEDQMAVAKYWYERYQAVPAVITRDVLEYDVPAPVQREKAMELAMEQYTFCPDIVEQGCESVGYLADTLTKSSKWYFWWD